MPDFVMLHGPAYSGKSTLAHRLRDDGYMLINFTDNLKALASRSLTAAGHHVTMEFIRAHKEQYRPYLQVLSDTIGYNEDPIYITRACAEWERAGRPSVVFDNVRSIAQATELRHLGFRLVEILLPLEVRKRRAENNGHSYDVRNYHHAIEQPLSDSIARSQVLLGSKAADELALEVRTYAQ